MRYCFKNHRLLFIYIYNMHVTVLGDHLRENFIETHLLPCAADGYLALVRNMMKSRDGVTSGTRSFRDCGGIRERLYIMMKNKEAICLC